MREEVDVVSTTSTKKKKTAPSTKKSPKLQAVGDRLFPGGISSPKMFIARLSYVAAITLIGVWWLFAVGMGVPIFNAFPNAAWLPIIIMTVLSLAWPAYMAVKKQNWLAIAIMAAVFLVVLLMPFVMRILESFGKGLWSLPFVGPLIFPPLAIALMVYGLLRLADLGVSEKSTKASAEHETLFESQKDFQAKFNAVGIELESYQSTVDGKKKSVDGEQQLVYQKRKVVATAKEKLEKAVKDDPAIKAKLQEADELQKETQSLEEDIKIARLTIVTETDGNSKKALQKSINDLTNKVKLNKALIEKLMGQYAELEKAFRLDHATAQNLDKAEKELADADETLKTAKRLLKESKRQFEAKQTESEALKMSLSGATSKLNKATERLTGARQVTARDRTGNLIFIVSCFVVSFVLYSTWYGWVSIAVR